MTDLKEKLSHLLKERLPILAVDLLIDGTRWAKDLTDRSAKLLADGTIPAPGFLVDRARTHVKEQEEMYRVLEPDEDWEARPFTEPAPPPKKAAPKKAAPKKKKAAPKKKKAATKAKAKKAKAKTKAKKAKAKKAPPKTEPPKEDKPS